MKSRSQLVIGTQDLPRRPGSMSTYDLEVAAPADLAIEVIGVPEGALMKIDLRLESVMEGILATADITAPLVGECVRCLNEVNDTLNLNFQELFAYPGVIEIDPEDEEGAEIYEVERDHIDLEPPVRDAIVLALPFQPYCRPDCRGLCPDCGINLNDAPAEHTHDHIDIRWASLVDALKDDVDPSQGEPTP